MTFLFLYSAKFADFVFLIICNVDETTVFIVLLKSMIMLCFPDKMLYLEFLSTSFAIMEKDEQD